MKKYEYMDSASHQRLATAERNDAVGCPLNVNVRHFLIAPLLTSFETRPLYGGPY